MEHTQNVLKELRKAKEHFQQKAFLSDNEESKLFYKGKASGLQLSIEHVQSLVYKEQDSWENFIDKMFEEWKELQEVKQ